MKIGTLTFHRACNYGGTLQCFALIKTLQSMGYEAEVADYRNPAIEHSYELISTNSLRAFVSSLFNFYSSYRKYKNFKCFRNKFIPTSKMVYHSASDLSNKYDICFIGSDQVWSKRINHGFDPVYWGNFEGKKATYAASMGTDHNYSEDEYAIIKDYLKNFDFISTREDSLRDEITPFTDKPIKTVIDPTLLITRKEYEEIAIRPKEDNYVLYYQMMYNQKSKDFVTNIAEQLGCKVITIMGPNERYEGVKHIHKTVSQVNVQEFIGYILNAKCVIASSFHGTALPIAMRKDFYFLANAMTDRSANLLRYLGASERMRDSKDKIKFEAVDYSIIEDRLENLKKESIDYIRKSIDI